MQESEVKSWVSFLIVRLNFKKIIYFWLYQVLFAALRIFTVACVCLLSRFSRVWLFATLWTLAHEAPLSLEFSRQEYWSGLPWLPPGDLPVPGIRLESLVSPALAGKFFISSATWETSLWHTGPLIVMYRWVLGLKPMCPALQGGFSTTGPPGKSSSGIFKTC